MNKLSHEQVQQLIDFVQARPAMYDRRDARYKSVDWKDRKWKEIASHLCTDVKDCKSAWRCLKDQFVKRLKEFKGKTFPEAEERPKKYKNFERLLFLQDSIESRKQRRNFDKINISETTNMGELPCTELSSTQTVPVPDIYPVSMFGGYTCSASTSSSSGEKRTISPVPEPLFEFETCGSPSHTEPEPEVSPAEGNEAQDLWCVSSSNSTSSKKIKTENMTDEFSSLLDKLTYTINTQESDSVDIFFHSIAKSAKSFNLSPIEISTLMVGVTEILHKIIANRQQ